MGHRLTRIYTRTGDDGTTGLAGGKRVPKRSARIAAIGDIDETSSALALVLAEQDVTPPLREILVRIQHELFEIGGTLAVQYTSDGEPSRRGMNPPKQYTAAYKPPVAAVAPGDLL
ncbi:MAG: ATP:cob(I)alamin adenosyltransferase [Gammaproteobacteria bacterium]